MNEYYELNGNTFKLLYYLKESNDSLIGRQKYTYFDARCIMKKLKLSRSTLYRCLNELEERQLISREKYHYDRNRIFINEK